MSSAGSTHPLEPGQGAWYHSYRMSEEPLLQFLKIQEVEREEGRKEEEEEEKEEEKER